jgi:hypothetical protein
VNSRTFGPYSASVHRILNPAAVHAPADSELQSRGTASTHCRRRASSESGRQGWWFPRCHPPPPPLPAVAATPPCAALGAAAPLRRCHSHHVKLHLEIALLLTPWMRDDTGSGFTPLHQGSIWKDGSHPWLPPKHILFSLLNHSVELIEVLKRKSSYRQERDQGTVRHAFVFNFQCQRKLSVAVSKRITKKNTGRCAFVVMPCKV